jgi:hypothetical protein
VTAAVIDLAGYRARRDSRHVDAPLNWCDQPTISAVCATPTGSGPCGAGLAYQGGRWQHVNTGGWLCDEPQPAVCQHPLCERTAEAGQPCAVGLEHCCGDCCWVHDDELEGHTLWPTS